MPVTTVPTTPSGAHSSAPTVGPTKSRLAPDACRTRNISPLGPSPSTLPPASTEPTAEKDTSRRSTAGAVAGRRGRLLTLSTAVGGGVGGQRERHAAAGFVGGWFHGAVAGDFFDTRARDLELARRIKHRAPVTPVVVVEDPRAEHDG